MVKSAGRFRLRRAGIFVNSHFAQIFQRNVVQNYHLYFSRFVVYYNHEREVIEMKDIIKMIVWFVVLNCCVSFMLPEPSPYWILIETIIVIISILMVDKDMKMW